MFRTYTLLALTVAASQGSLLRRLSSSSPTETFKMNEGRIIKEDLPIEGRTKYRYIPNQQHGTDVPSWSFYLEGNKMSTEVIHCPQYTFYYDTSKDGFAELTSFLPRDSPVGQDPIVVNKGRVFLVPTDPFAIVRLHELDLTERTGVDVMKLLARKLGNTAYAKKRQEDRSKNKSPKDSPTFINNMPDLFNAICEIYQDRNSQATFYI